MHWCVGEGRGEGEVAGCRDCRRGGGKPKLMLALLAFCIPRCEPPRTGESDPFDVSVAHRRTAGVCVVCVGVFVCACVEAFPELPVGLYPRAVGPRHPHIFLTIRANASACSANRVLGTATNGYEKLLVVGPEKHATQRYVQCAHAPTVRVRP